jgi:hypothetical protein
MKKKIFNLIIVDASGSMKSKEEEVKGGLRILLKQIADDHRTHPELENTVCITDFSNHDDFRVLIDNAPVTGQTDFDVEQYATRGMTALYDAIGLSFRKIPAGTDSAFISIFTDGEENDSKEFTAEGVKQLVEEARKKNWAVVFMGTSEASMLQARRMGVSDKNLFLYRDSKLGTALAYDKMAGSRKMMNEKLKANESLDDLMDE